MSKESEPDEIVTPGPIAAAATAVTIAQPAVGPAGPPKKRRGRPPKFSPEVAKLICDLVRAGNFLNRAARTAGISVDTLANWRERGATGELPFATFLADLEKAELDCEAWHVLNWRNQAPQDWRASKEFLARRYPELWSDHAGRLAVFGPDGDGEGVTFNIQINLSPEALERPDPIPEVTADDARAIERAAPSIKV
jgi:hypothetical protein